MPSFDIVSEVDWQEVKNSINQSNKEITNRFDFKGSNANIAGSDPTLTLLGDDEFKIGKMMEILQMKLAKRGLDLGCLNIRRSSREWGRQGYAGYYYQTRS